GGRRGLEGAPRPQRRRPAGGGPGRPGAVLRGRGHEPRAARAPARLGLQALPALRRALRLRRRAARPPRPLPLPQRRLDAPDARPLTLLLVKNPAGANEVLRTLILEGGELDLLGVLNDRTADGRDVSWVWDADFELIAPRVRRITCSGTRAAELAVRFKYAGV